MARRLDTSERLRAIELVDASTLVTSDGRPVMAASEYEAGAMTADGRPIRAVSVASEVAAEGGYITPIALFEQGALMTSDGRHVFAVMFFAADGVADPSEDPIEAPANTALPTISGTPTEGQTLTASPGTWTNEPSTKAYQWEADGTPIADATNTTLLLTSAHVGDVITVVVTATNVVGAGTPAESVGTAPVAAAPDTTAPTITSGNPSGSYAEGDAISGTLTANETVTWSKSGADASALTLNTSTGVWSLAATDYETKTSYSITVTATDGTGNTASQAWAFTITDVAEGGGAGPTGTEDAAIGAPVLYAASDPTAYPPAIEVDLSNVTSDVAADNPQLYFKRSDDYAGSTNVIWYGPFDIPASGPISTPSFSAIASGTFYVRALVAHASTYGPTSNVVQHGTAAARTLTSANTFSVAENLTPYGFSVTSAEPFALAIVGGFDQDEFTAQAGQGTTRTLTLGAQNVSADTPLTVDILVTFPNGTTAAQTITGTVTAADETPDAFSFAPVTGAPASTQQVSEWVTFSGLGSGISTVVHAGGAEYQIWRSGNSEPSTSDPWLTAADTGANNDKGRLRLTSSATGFGSASATLTVGEGSATWTVQTAGAYSGSPTLTPRAAPAPYIGGGYGPEYTFTGISTGTAASDRIFIVAVSHSSNADATTARAIPNTGNPADEVAMTEIATALSARIYACLLPLGTAVDVKISTAPNNFIYAAIQAFTAIGVNVEPVAVGGPGFNYDDPTPTMTPTVGTDQFAIGFIAAEGSGKTITVSSGATLDYLVNGGTFARTFASAHRTTAGNLTFTGHAGANSALYAVFGA